MWGILLKIYLTQSLYQIYFNRYYSLENGSIARVINLVCPKNLSSFLDHKKGYKLKARDLLSFLEWGNLIDKNNLKQSFGTEASANKALLNLEEDIKYNLEALQKLSVGKIIEPEPGEEISIVNLQDSIDILKSVNFKSFQAKIAELLEDVMDKIEEAELFWKKYTKNWEQTSLLTKALLTVFYAEMQHFGKAFKTSKLELDGYLKIITLLAEKKHTGLVHALLNKAIADLT